MLHFQNFHSLLYVHRVIHLVFHIMFAHNTRTVRSDREKPLQPKTISCNKPALSTEFFRRHTRYFFFCFNLSLSIMSTTEKKRKVNTLLVLESLRANVGMLVFKRHFYCNVAGILQWVH